MRRTLALLSAGALIACAPAGTASGADDPLRSLAQRAGQPAPILRIGLEHAHTVSISSRSPYRVIDPATGDAVWKPEFAEELQVVAEGGPSEAVPSVFRVQVGAFRDRDSASRELARLAELTGATGTVHYDPDRGNWRVRLGRADDRLALGELMDRLREAGLEGLWIAEEPSEAAGDVRLRLVDRSYESFASTSSRVAVLSSDDSPIAVAGKSYRGVIELRVSPFGTVRPVNWINLEQYLLGVVPAELGPEMWPELAALEAQAIAARTYAWRNRGQFGDEGFDLCDTPRCQVYAGAAAEHPLSDRAVWSTRGQILTWKGEPIIALYTATCGGHTEHVKEIFPEHDEPYLRGVPCRAEEDALATLGATVEGRPIPTVTDETGADVTRDWTLLAVAGVVGPDRGDPARPVDVGGLHAWTVSLAELAGLPEPPEESGRPVETLAGAAAALVDQLGWAERARVLLDTEDLPAVLRDRETETLAQDERRALAYLVSVDAIRPYPDGRFRPTQPVTRGRLAPALVRVGESYRAFSLRTGTVSHLRDRTIRLVRDKSSVEMSLAPDVALFGWSGGMAVPASRLDLWPGDRVRYRATGGAIDFLELRPPVKGTSDDRSAKVYSWEVRRTRRELEAAVNARVSVGRLKDLEVVRRGVSGRIVELRVIGSRASSVVRGFDVRRLLDLRESLLVIEPQRDANGEIVAVVFAGKGWGHGVGLCQVGAYGMALRGASFREILEHYYHGAKLEPLKLDPS